MTQDQTPSLRFPEFRGAGAWEMKKLGEVCDLQDGYAFSPKNFTNSAIDAIQVIRITDINNKNKNADKVYVPTSLVKILKLDKYMVQEGDLLLSLTGAAGFNFFLWNSKPALINQRTMKIMAKEKLNTTLLKLLEPLIHTEINSHGTGQNNNVSKETLKHTLSFLPKPDEQKEIAACLSSLDEVITIHGDRLDELKDYKTGLIQQLFPADGQTTPTLRFPEFQGKDPWEEILISQILSESKVPSKDNDPQKRITVKLTLQGIVHRNFKGTEAKNATKHFVREAGQFIYGKQNIHKGAFGIIPNHLDGFETSQDLPAFDFTELCHPSWFLYYIEREFFYASLEMKMSGTGSKRLKPEVFCGLTITIPSLAEQQKITDCLSALDDLIIAQEQKIKTLKHHKNGLMQQLFPKL